MTSREITGLDPATGRPLRITAEDGIITRIDPSNDDTDLYFSAGFVDLQVNGYAGFDVNADDLTVEAVTGLVHRLLAHGVTCFAPTLITAPEQKICRNLRVIAEARRSDPVVAACCPAIHVEGPSISPLDGFRGAHAADAVRPPSLAEFERWQQAAGGAIGIVTLSPHFGESREYIAALVKRCVHVALGHTHATPEEIGKAVEAGASLSTHLGNGVALEIPRHRNVIWPQLAEDRLTATFIADGHHLPSDVLRVMLRAKSIARSVLISDSVALAGMPAGIYSTPVGGRVELRPDGKLCVLGTEMLAGSTASLTDCISHAIESTDVSLPEALLMATANPGRFVGDRGRIAVGSRADVVRFRWSNQLVVDEVWLGGERVSNA